MDCIGSAIISLALQPIPFSVIDCVNFIVRNGLV
uniref:Uncharacterized protein n=1 Tax=Anguilla anguilla TaxID=7936 RepID=A0A0E9QT83_ANGAN